MSEEKPAEQPVEQPIVENQDLKDLLDTPAEALPAPVAPAPAKQEVTPDEAQRVFKTFMAISTDILNNYKSDRDQIEKTIVYLEQMSQLGPKGGRVYVEMLVAALKTKAETNTNAVKILDAMAKMVSAGKGTPIFIQQNQGSSPVDLRALLDAPKYPDEK